MTGSTLVPAKLTHVGPIASRMRAIDAAECAAFGRSPKEGLRYSLRTAWHALTALAHDGTPVAMMGVGAVNLLNGIGSPWFLGRDEVFDYPRDLLLDGRRVIQGWLESFERLENMVSVDNDRAIRLLRRWGAIVEDGPTVRHGSLDFVRFRFGRCE